MDPDDDVNPFDDETEEAGAMRAGGLGDLLGGLLGGGAASGDMSAILGSLLGGAGGQGGGLDIGGLLGSLMGGAGGQGVRRTSRPAAGSWAARAVRRVRRTWLV